MRHYFIEIQLNVISTPEMPRQIYFRDKADFNQINKLHDDTILHQIFFQLYILKIPQLRYQPSNQPTQYQVFLRALSCGPFFFYYINDLPLSIMSKAKLYTNDTLIRIGELMQLMMQSCYKKIAYLYSICPDLVDEF